MKRWQWWAARGADKFNHAGMTLLFLLGLCLVLQTMGVQPRETAVAESAASLSQLQGQLQQIPNRPVASAPDAAAKTLPSTKNLVGELKQLHGLANKAGLNFSQADYEMQREGQKHWRYRMESEGEFSYPATKQFLREAFTQLPNLTLDNLDIERDNTNNGIPRVRLSLSLYYADEVRP